VSLWLFLLAPGLCISAIVAWLWLHPQSAGEPRGIRKTQFQKKRMNRLAQEKSPYLLQHAANPVDWYPWGDEAFEKARREQKPVFLSIGYSTCHWCHVMERESFENEEIARTLNEHFVSIKVDREERPDVDRIYMTFVQATTGSGGWPMSVFLTPDRKPFAGGTYFPPADRHGRPGFRTVLLRIAEAWRNDRAQVVSAADNVIQSLRQMAGAGYEADAAPGPNELIAAYQRFARSYDRERGGFGPAPKFPRPSVFNFLLRYYARAGEKQALDMTTHTLRAMAAGGMHDHVGGGFHRYSVDPNWHVPHFEKMLYDQAQLAVAYAEAFQITREAAFAEVVHDILRYVLRDLRSPEGAFYSAEDADSLFEPGQPEHGEGAFYIWKASEIAALLGPDAAMFNAHYGVKPDGNVPAEWDQQNEFRGRNILIERSTLEQTAKAAGKSLTDAKGALAAARLKLFEARNRRPRPHLDDKLLTAWNGLMITALARSSQALYGDPQAAQYLAAAQDGAQFLRSRMFHAQSGRLWRRYRAGEAAIDGFVDDYAYLIQGLLDLYEAGFDAQWLEWAVRLQEKQDELFWDAAGGGYYSTTGKDPSILVRMREDYDGAEPSPNSVAALNLLRLAQMTGRDAWRERAERTLAVFWQRLHKMPETLPQMAVAVDFARSKPRQIVLAGAAGAPDTTALLRVVHERFLPHRILLLADGGETQQRLAANLPFLATVTRKDGKATAYICENFVCRLPTNDPATVAKLLASR
jgi:uncharacterized protein YyaL (SSP411 family)